MGGWISLKRNRWFKWKKNTSIEPKFIRQIEIIHFQQWLISFAQKYFQLGKRQKGAEFDIIRQTLWPNLCHWFAV